MRRNCEDPNQLSFFPMDEDWYIDNADRIGEWKKHMENISDFSHDFLDTFLDDIGIEEFFYWSVNNCNQRIFNFCVHKHGFDFINKTHEIFGGNILHKFSNVPNLDRIKFLVDNGAKPLINKPNFFGVLPIHLAANRIFQAGSETSVNNAEKVVKYYLSQGSKKEHQTELFSTQSKMIDLIIEEISKSNVI